MGNRPRLGFHRSVKGLKKRGNVARLLEYAQGKVVPSIATDFVSGSPFATRLAAIAALKEISTPEALDALRTLADSGVEEAAEALATARLARPNNVEPNLQEMLEGQTGDPAFVHRANWVTAFGKKDFKTALAEVNAALTIVPNDPLYLSLRAMTHHSLQDYAETQVDLKTALKNNPTQKEALGVKEALRTEATQCRDKARELGRKNDHRGALELLDKAAALQPDDASTFLFRGLTHAQLENLTTAIADVTRALELDPQIPDGRKVLQSLQSIAASAPVPSASGTYFCLVCSGNRSLIASFYDMYRSSAPDVEVGQFKATIDALRAKRDEAASRDLSFDGSRFTAEKEERVDKLDAVLGQMTVGASQDVHMLLVAAHGDMYVRTQLLFREILSQAVRQGILPFPMFATQSAETKHFLVDAFQPA